MLNSLTTQRRSTLELPIIDTLKIYWIYPCNIQSAVDIPTFLQKQHISLLSNSGQHSRSSYSRLMQHLPHFFWQLVGGPCGWFPAFAEALQHGWPLWLMWWYSKVTVPGEPLSPIQPFPLTPLSDCTFPCVFPLSCYTVHLSPMQLLPFPPLTPVKSPR